MMNNDISNILASTNLPSQRPWMDNVIRIFVNGIPEDCHQFCISSAQKRGSRNDTDYLLKFVQDRLQILAEREYKLWINGRMPFITPRELQLWRLRQFVQYIWFWNLPDDNDLAMIFNATQRKASNLINDFIARFRKTLLFPISIRRLYVVLRGKPIREKVVHRDKKNVLGNLYYVMSKRYLSDLDMFINEMRMRVPNHSALANSYFYDRDILLIWVDDRVVKLIQEDDDLINAIFSLYPTPEQDDE